MIKVETKEYSENDLAVKTIKVIFFGVLIYNSRYTTTSSSAIKELTPVTKINKITGFKYETKDKSKKNK